MNILEILGNVGFDWPVAVANLVNFLIIFYVLKRFAFGPLKRVIAERTEKINEGLENAARAETELVMAKQAFTAEVEKGKEEANTIIASAHTQGESLLHKAAQKAEADAHHILREAHTQAEKDRERMEREVQGKTVDLVIAGVEKVLKEELTSEQDIARITQLVARST